MVGQNNKHLTVQKSCSKYKFVEAQNVFVRMSRFRLMIIIIKVVVCVFKQMLSSNGTRIFDFATGQVVQTLETL